MICKVITSFCGVVNGARGQIIDLTDEQAEDLKRAGYVVPVAGRTPTVTPGTPKDTEVSKPAEAPAEETPETTETPEAPKPKRSRKK